MKPGVRLAEDAPGADLVVEVLAGEGPLAEPEPQTPDSRRDVRQYRAEGREESLAANA